MVAPVEKPPEKKRHRFHKPDDNELARGLVRAWDNQRRYFHSEWHSYESGVWNVAPLPRVNVAAIKYLEEQQRQADVKISRGCVNSVVSLAADYCYVEDHQIDQGDQYINLRNGLFNLTTFKMEQHQPGLYLTNQLDFDYDPDADAPTFRRYCNTSLVHPGTLKTDHKLILLLQEALGYSITADTSLKASFWLVGKPDSGKSTLISFIRALLGSLHTTIDLNQLGNKFMLARIVGKRAVTFTEAKVNSVLPDDVFKNLVGGTDEIFADVKNQPAISFVPKSKLWWAMNEPPRVVDRSGAVYNRLYAIPFNRSIPASERITNLSERLAAERAGVFNWLMEGYHRLRLAGHFTQCEQSETLKEQYRLENDTELSFMVDEIIVDPDGSMPAQLLYDTYRGWCEKNGFKPKNINQAAREWERLGFERIVMKGWRYWKGGKLKNQIF